MRLRPAAKMVALDHTLKSAPFAHAHDVDKSLALKNVHQHAVAGFHRAIALGFFVDFNRHFADKLHRRKIVFPRWPFIGCVSRDSFTNSTKPICAAGYPSLVSVLCCVITHGPACKTVAGCTSPLSSNSCVIPTLFPKIPATLPISFSIPAWPVVYWLTYLPRAPSPDNLRSPGPPSAAAPILHLCSFPNAL